MASQAHQLLFRPFRETIKWASLGIVHSQDSSNDPRRGAELQRASGLLLRDAERAVKRLAPYVENPTPELHAFLIDLICRNTDVIAEVRAVDVLLYDFEDYIEASSYDEAKFDALRAATKALALLLLERIQRFSTESALDASPPPLRPLPPLPARANLTKIVTQPSPHSPEHVERKGSIPRQIHPGDLTTTLSSKFTARQTVAEVRPGSPEGAFVGLDRLELGSPITMSSMARPGSATGIRGVQTPEPRGDAPYRPRRTSLMLRDRIREEETSSFVEFDSQDQDTFASPETQAPKSNTYMSSHQQRPSSSSRWHQTSDEGSELGDSTINRSYTASSLNTAALASRDSTFDQKTSISSSATSHSSHRASLLGNAAKNSCSIGPGSSLSLLGGFCKGARAFATGGPGQAIKKVGGSGGNQGSKQDFSQEMLFGSMLAVETTIYAEPMAQCLHCDYKTIYSQLLQDMDRDPLAKQQVRGMTYRSRFLYKSHVAVKDLEKVFFACIFCDKLKSTCHEGDATVFQSVDHLFRHLSRHTLPLATVAGVTVLYEEPKFSSADQQDFDLIIPGGTPMLPAGPPEEARDYLASLPEARATKDHIRQRNGKPQSRPDNVSEVLQFLAGARILGVEYPDKWDGKWCQGWHDGVLGVFPSKTVQLEAPEKVQTIIKSVPRSLRTGVAKWEWDSKSRTGSNVWLSFSKGAKISNLAWDDPHAWYWIGTNSKGMLGIFPKSHIRIETIQDGSLDESNGATKSSGGRSRLGSLFGRSKS
ncbi:hypothetical protein BKA56DRAFT_589397 [Ilyonectria sp. MPI-CAGE-AT-0026]|nr:hypothetical protein BKA56DRAFT_589397 [Ilyonectria sp. MPI-CAGE-AT-0026]